MALFLGGAIINFGNLSLTACTLYNNHAYIGGAIANVGTLTINQCTLTGNSSLVYGSAIYSEGSLTINHSTIAQNVAGVFGGGVFVNSGSFSLFNSIVAGNTGPNISGAYTEKGTNLVSGDPLLLPLSNYGGPTPTMPPCTNSPALNAGADFINTGLFGAPVWGHRYFPHRSARSAPDIPCACGHRRGGAAIADGRHQPRRCRPRLAAPGRQ